MNTALELFSDNATEEELKEVIEISRSVREDVEATEEIASLRSIVMEVQLQQEYMFTTT